MQCANMVFPSFVICPLTRPSKPPRAGPEKCLAPHHHLANLGRDPSEKWSATVRTRRSGLLTLSHGGNPVPERWLPIPGFENYEVSSEGRVRSLARLVQ